MKDLTGDHPPQPLKRKTPAGLGWLPLLISVAKSTCSNFSSPWIKVKNSVHSLFWRFELSSIVYLSKHLIITFCNLKLTPKSILDLVKQSLKGCVINDLGMPY